MLQDREHQPHHQTKVLTLGGQFNRRTIPDIQGQLLGAVEMGCHHIILDFSGVMEVDSTSLGELFLWHHQMQLHHVQISIVNPTSYVRTRFDWANLLEIIPIYETEAEAMEHTCLVT